MKQTYFFILSVLIVQWAHADDSRFKIYKENSEKRATIVNSKPLKVFYKKISWNQEPTQVEFGYLYLKDRKSGQLVEMKMIETQPDSGIFNMEYGIGSLSQAEIETEIFSAPQSMLAGANRLDVMQELIADNSVKRKPFLLRVLRQQGQVVDVFDKREEALNSYNKYREQMGLSPEQIESQSIIEVANKEKPEKKKIIDTSTLQSLFIAEEHDLDATNQKNQELREVLSEMEKKRRAGVQEQARSWSRVQKNKNLRETKIKVKQAVSDLKSTKFNNSMENFFEASNLSPFEEDLYEQYGVSLFRNEKLNQSIVVLELSNPSAARIPEKHFYLGMNYYKLKDYEKAIEHFNKVLELKNESFGPTSAFYKGSALIELKRFDESKEAFQYVLDHSKNPEMDKRAEKFIEYALDRKTIEEKRKNWFFMDGVLGLIYDSNIILARDQAREQGLVTDEEGWRALAQVSMKARPFYGDTDELSVQLDLTGLQSFDNGFGSNAVAETADPYIIGIGVPWTHRGTLGGKGYFFDLVPGYETIMMDLDGTGMATITESIKLDFNNTLVVNKNWIAKGDWFFASNDSNILGDENSADSFSAGFKMTSILVLNKDLERYLIPEFGYRINNAEGSSYAFNRIDLAMAYSTSIFWGMMWNNRFGYYLANYESDRADNNYTLSSGISRRISTHWNWGLQGSYIINDSTTNSYNKYNFVSTFSFSY